MLARRDKTAGKAVLITGASSGIGASVARRLAARAFDVFAVVRQGKDAQILSEVNGVEPLMLDIRKEDSVRAAIQAIHPRLLEYEEVHLVNNAGIVLAGPVECLSLDRWREQFDVNVFGLLAVTQAMLPLVRIKRGRVINVSSIGGLVATPFLGAYSASKFAVEAISDALRRELKSTGCKVIVVEPGPTATPIWEKNFGAKEELLDKFTAEQRAIYSRGLEWFEKESRKSAESATPVERVSGVIEKALLARKPRTRYVVGSRGLAIQMAAASLVPDPWLDFLLTRGLEST